MRQMEDWPVSIRIIIIEILTRTIPTERFPSLLPNSEFLQNTQRFVSARLKRFLCANAKILGQIRYFSPY